MLKMLEDSAVVTASKAKAVQICKLATMTAVWYSNLLEKQYFNMAVWKIKQKINRCASSLRFGTFTITCLFYGQYIRTTLYVIDYFMKHTQ